MRLAIGQPLQDVSETVLKKVGSKSLKSSGLRKYNPYAPKKSGVSAKRRDKSPMDAPDYGDLSKEVVNCLG